MINIPTELLRTLLAVVDMRSFTKAARALGVTQPAVSAQIKRLQSLLGFDLFDKSAPGVSVTEKGDRVVCEARRLLAVNDQIVSLARASDQAPILRLGLPGDCLGLPFWQRLAAFRKRWETGLSVTTGSGPGLVEELHRGDLDVVMTMSSGKPERTAAQHWRDELAWIRGAEAIDPTRPLQLLSRGEDCILHRAMIAALQAVERDYEIVLTAANVSDLTEAVAAGLGVTALPRSFALSPGAQLCEDDVLPKLADIVFSVSVRDHADRGASEDLAALLAEAFMTAPSISLANRADKLGVKTAPRRIPVA
jgi:DNA-binding transcriptional LysR family regulator